MIFVINKPGFYTNI